MASLEAYLAGPGAAPWRWGSLDCIQFACGWIVAATGRDPGEAYRDRYSTKLGAHRFIMQAGGLVRLITPAMREAGFIETTDPQSGDVGIVKVPTDTARNLAAVGAIRVGAYWVVRGQTSLVYQDFPILAAWSIPFWQ